MANNLSNIEPIDDLEDLLKQRDAAKYGTNQVIVNNHSQSLKLQRAKKNASLDDFIEMVNRIVTKALKKYDVHFSPDEGSKVKVASTETLTYPWIQYSVKSREPRRDYIKPRPREDFAEYNPDGTEGRKGMVYSQIFDCIIQFDILASDYAKANAVMNAFEDAMFNYTAHFKENGISEMYFLKQFTDSDLDIYRNNVSVRSLQYKVSIERNRLQYDVLIDNFSNGLVENS